MGVAPLVNNPDRGNLPEDQWQLARLVKNPDVSVRMRGVMEKCTFCLQRIEQAKIAPRSRRATADHIRLPEGARFQDRLPAGLPGGGDCLWRHLRPGQQRDPVEGAARAITRCWNFLNTKPRLTYLARVRNPNPEMPDYKSIRSLTRRRFEARGRPAGRTGALPRKERR